MAGRQPARARGGVFGGVQTWLEEQESHADRLRREAEAKVREVQNAIDRLKPKAVDKRVLSAAKDQGLAAGRGAQDAFTFGLGDHAYAGTRALIDATHGQDLQKAYRARIAAERQRDEFDRKNFGAARTAGQIAGTAAQIAATGGVAGAALNGVKFAIGGARIAQTTPLLAREAAALGGSGGVLGLAGQVQHDVAEGRVSAAGDYAGSAIGGVVGAMAARSGRAGYAGAAEGATTSAAQDLFNGRAISIDRARNAAVVGGALGGAGDLIGRGLSNSMRRKSKEQLGEMASRVRTRVRGDQTATTQKSRAYMPNGKYTYPDQRTVSGGLVESKFGRSAKLSPRQIEATQLLPDYRVDHILPRDVGSLVGLPMSTVGILNYEDLIGPEPY